MDLAANPWAIFYQLLYFAGSLACLCASIWVASRRDRFGKAGNAFVAGLVMTSIWCAVGATLNDTSLPASLTESARNLLLLLATYRLFASDGRHETVAPIRPVVLALAFVELLYSALILSVWFVAGSIASAEFLFNIAVTLRLLFVVGILMLVHNLYLGASPQARQILRWPATALAALWVLDLNLYTIAYLGHNWPYALAALRGLAAAALAAMLTFGAIQGRETLRLRPSRAATFQTVSLIVIGSYFIAMFTLAEWLAVSGGDFSRLMQTGMLVLGSGTALFVLPSRKLRGWLRVTIAKHLFQHRYDYRAEWMRFTRTIGSTGDPSLPLQQRAVQAVADIAESPAGLLLVPDDNGELVLGTRWQWPAADVPAAAMTAASVDFFERESYILDLDDLRSGADERGEAASVPQWLIEETRAWALIPLIHYDRLIALIVLARPIQARKFDWEDFDLLRVVGQQLASYLAEHDGQQALAEANRFEDFNRRIAFVMHDIKNLASQLGLLARNAEKHADNPAFRDDMLVTLRNSAEKLNTLLARLSRYGAGTVDKLSSVDGAALVQSVVNQMANQHGVILTQSSPCEISADHDSLEQVLVHLVQNSIDASDQDDTVFVALTHDEQFARIEVVDSGTGMSPEFVQTKLFKPFISTKQGGFGIGAFEARELVRAMKGRLDVESREGLGSRFVIRLPLAATAEHLRTLENTDQKVA